MVKTVLLTALLILAGCANHPVEDEVLTPLPVQERLDNAQRLLGSGEFVRAGALFEGVLAESPESAGALAGMALVHLHEGALAQADAALDQAEALAADDLDVREARALLLLTERQLAAAADAFTGVLADDAGRWRSLDGLAVTADLQGRHDDAQRLYHKALAAGAPEVKVNNNLGFSYLMSGDYDQARAVLEHLLNRYPDAERARANLALAQARDRNYSAALATWRQIMSDAQAHNNVGYVAMLNGDLADAERYLSRALTLSPRYYPAADANLAKVRMLRQSE